MCSFDRGVKRDAAPGGPRGIESVSEGVAKLDEELPGRFPQYGGHREAHLVPLDLREGHELDRILRLPGRRRPAFNVFKETDHLRPVAGRNSNRQTLRECVGGPRVFLIRQENATELLECERAETPTILPRDCNASLGMAPCDVQSAVAISGQYAYANIAGSFAIDISDPHNPQIANRFDSNMGGQKVTVSGSVAYVPMDGFVLAYDLSDPGDPRILGESPMGGHQVAVLGSRLYGAGGERGFYTLPGHCEASATLWVGAESFSARPLLVYPSPASRHATIRVQVPEDESVSATLYNSSGRLVRSLGRNMYDAGTHDLLWDTRDDAGRAVSPGVYLARVSTVREERVARIVIVR